MSRSEMAHAQHLDQLDREARAREVEEAWLVALDEEDKRGTELTPNERRALRYARRRGTV